MNNLFDKFKQAVQGIKYTFNTAKSNIKGNVAAISNPQTRSTWVQGFTPARAPVQKATVQPIRSYSTPAPRPVYQTPTPRPTYQSIVPQRSSYTPTRSTLDFTKVLQPVKKVSSSYLNTYSKVSPYVPFAPKVYTPQQMSQGLNTWGQAVQNRVIQPAKQIVSPKSTLLERGAGALQTAGNVFAPGFMAGYAGYEGLKSGIQALQKKQNFTQGFQKGFTGQNIPSAGELITKNPYLRTGINVAEFAAPFFMGGTKTKGIDKDIKSYARLIKSNKLKEAQSLIEKLPETSKTKWRMIEHFNKVIEKNIKPLVEGGVGKTKGFIKTVQESGKTAKQVKQILSEATNVDYVPKPNDKLVKMAQFQVRNNPAAAEQYVRTHINDQSVATAHQLIDYYTRLKNYDKAADIAIENASSLLEAGRTVQAASLYNKLTPAGIQRYAATQLQKFNQVLRPEDAKTLSTMALKIQKMKSGQQKILAQQQLMEEVSKLIPTPALRKIITLWKANLLTSLKTSIRNITSNTLMAGLEKTKDVPATVTDMVASIFTGKRTKTLTGSGLLSGFEQGWEEGVNLMKTGVDTRKTLGKLDLVPVNWGNKPVAKAAEIYTNTVFRFLGAQDKPFYYSRLKNSLYDQAGAEAMNLGKGGNKAFIQNLVDNPTEKMIKIAIKDAETAVFQQSTVIGQTINKAKRFLEKEATKGDLTAQVASALAEFTVPFTGVPSGIAMSTLSYTPVGMVKTIIENIGKGKFDQRQFSEGMARGITGTGLMAIGVSLAKNNLVTFEYPTSEREKQQWQLEGKIPWAIKIGGKWRSIASLGPWAQVLLAGAQYYKKGAGGAAVGMLKSQQEQTFLKGMSSLTEAMAAPERKGSQFISNIVGGFVPNIMSDVAKGIDPYQREIPRTNNIIADVEATLQSKTPIYRQSLIPKRNAFGELVKTEPAGIGQLIDIFNSSKDKSDPLIKELGRLLEEGQAATPTRLDKQQSYKTMKFNLSDKELDILEEKSGALTKKYLEKAINLPKYKLLTDPQKKLLLNKLVEKTRYIEKLKYMKGSGLTSKSALIINNLKQYKNKEEMKKYLIEEFKAGKITKQDLLNLKGYKQTATPTPTPQLKVDQGTVNQYKPVLNAIPQGARKAAEESLPNIVSALKEQGILTPRVLAYAMATIGHETANTFKPIEEYSGRQQARNLGYSGGENYFGRGYIQLTHDYNYKTIGDKIGVDLLNHPELALKPDIAAKILAVFLKESGTASMADSGDFYNARRGVNSGDYSTYQPIANNANYYLSML